METYNNLIEKEQYFHCQRIDTEQELQAALQNLDCNHDYAYRGAKDARFMMYSSAQRKWENTERTASDEAYHNTIMQMIVMIKANRDYQQFIGKHNIPNTDFFILGLMQHY